MMCDAQLLAHLDESDRGELPQVGDFHDFGKQIQYGRKTKRKPHRTPDSVANSQQRIRFDDNDRDHQRDTRRQTLGRTGRRL